MTYDVPPTLDRMHSVSEWSATILASLANTRYGGGGGGDFSRLALLCTTAFAH